LPIATLVSLTNDFGLISHPFVFVGYRWYWQQESRAAARKPRDAASVLFCWSSPTTFTTSI